jgi:uncharacterized membrane protein YdbT with pleckstrin-like domain
MSYVENNLLVSEHLLYRTSLHWIIFATGALWFVLAIIFLCIGKLLTYLGFIMLALTFYDFMISYVRYKTSEFALTNKRVIVKVGFIRRTIVEMFLQKVEGLQVDQPILGRLFGYGTIIICGTGGSRDYFAKIHEPFEFRKRVQQQIEIVLETK